MDDKRKHDLWGALLKYCQGKGVRHYFGRNCTRGGYKYFIKI